MFSFDSAADEGLLAGASDAELAAAGVDLARLENQCVARKILAAHELGRRVFDRVLAESNDHYRNRLPDKAAVRDVAWRFGVPAATAGRWLSLGAALADLPVVRRAFLGGDLTAHRTGLIAHALTGLGEHLLADAQRAALDHAAEAATGAVLADRLDAMLIELDPARAVDNREEFGQREQNVIFRKEIHGHTSIEATLPATDAHYLRARIAGMMSHCLCSRDPRPVGQQRAAALSAIGRGLIVMECACGLDDCAAPVRSERDPAEAGSPSTELVAVATRAVIHVVTDAPTLAGLTGEMVPYIEGYGAIDPAYVRELAADATWQGMYSESLRMTPVGEGFKQGTPRRGGRIVVPDHVEVPEHLRCAGSVAVRPRPPTARTVDLTVIDPSGHGGYTKPPTGALSHAPGAGLRHGLAHTDPHCRGPFCDRPNADCDLDHLVPFDHTDPLNGGWTLAANLAPLCRPCHEFKHLGIWTPTMCAGRSIVWRHTETGQTITTYP